MTELMTETHKEAGIIAYTLAQEVKGSKDLNNKVQPDKYYMIEHYKSLDAFIFHVKTPHFKKCGLLALFSSWEARAMTYFV